MRDKYVHEGNVVTNNIYLTNLFIYEEGYRVGMSIV